MGQVQFSDRQSSIIFYLVHQGKGRTEAACLVGFATTRQSAFTLTQSPKIIAKIRQDRNKVTKPSLCLGLFRYFMNLWRTRNYWPVQEFLQLGLLWSFPERLVSIHSPNESMSKVWLK